MEGAAVDVASHPVAETASKVAEAVSHEAASKETTEIVKTATEETTAKLETPAETTTEMTEALVETVATQTEKTTTESKEPVEASKEAEHTPETPKKASIWRRVYERIRNKLRRAKKTVGPAEFPSGPSTEAGTTAATTEDKTETPVVQGTTTETTEKKEEAVQPSKPEEIVKVGEPSKTVEEKTEIKSEKTDIVTESKTESVAGTSSPPVEEKKE